VRVRSPAELGALIRPRRRQLGLEQSALAGKVGVSRQCRLGPAVHAVAALRPNSSWNEWPLRSLTGPPVEGGPSVAVARSFASCRCAVMVRGTVLP
jgi:hypothetical protein